MKDKIIPFLKEGAIFLLRRILSIVLAIAVVVALSFLIWGPLNIQSYSDRLIWTGLGIAVIAGILVSAQTTGGRDFGTPGMFVRQAHTQTIIDFNIEARAAIESRMGIFPRMFFIGAILFGLGALVNVLFAS